MCYFDLNNPYGLANPSWYTSQTFVNYAPNGNPTVNVTVNKSRKRVYDTDGSARVFLKDGEEFELELFNPTTKRVGAQIFLNGAAISQRIIVINPGERAFIERYLDDNKRFKFATYEVEAGNSQVDAAIANNGSVEVRFFYEKDAPKLAMRTSSFGGQTRSRGLNLKSYGSNASYSSSSDVSMDSIMSFAPNFESAPQTKETGRVAEGSTSSQSFRNVSIDFEYTHFAAVSVKLEPLSNQPIEASEIRVYCAQCGRKQKPGEKFCPVCGTKHD
jgi:hypothetical protein